MISNPADTTPMSATAAESDELDIEPTAQELIREFNLKLYQAKAVALDTLAELCAPYPRPEPPGPDPYAGLTSAQRYDAKLREFRASPQPRASDPDQRRLANQERSVRLRAAMAIIRQKTIPDPTAPTPAANTTARREATQQRNSEHAGPHPHANDTPTSNPPTRASRTSPPCPPRPSVINSAPLTRAETALPRTPGTAHHPGATPNTQSAQTRTAPAP